MSENVLNCLFYSNENCTNKKNNIYTIPTLLKLNTYNKLNSSGLCFPSGSADGTCMNGPGAGVCTVGTGGGGGP